MNRRRAALFGLGTVAVIGSGIAYLISRHPEAQHGHRYFHNLLYGNTRDSLLSEPISSVSTKGASYFYVHDESDRNTIFDDLKARKAGQTPIDVYTRAKWGCDLFTVSHQPESDTESSIVSSIREYFNIWKKPRLQTLTGAIEPPEGMDIDIDGNPGNGRIHAASIKFGKLFRIDPASPENDYLKGWTINDPVNGITNNLEITIYPPQIRNRDLNPAPGSQRLFDTLVQHAPSRKEAEIAQNQFEMTIIPIGDKLTVYAHSSKERAYLDQGKVVLDAERPGYFWLNFHARDWCYEIFIPRPNKSPQETSVAESISKLRIFNRTFSDRDILENFIRFLQKSPKLGEIELHLKNTWGNRVHIQHPIMGKNGTQPARTPREPLP